MAINNRRKGSINFTTTAYWDAALANTQQLRISEGAESFSGTGIDVSGFQFYECFFEAGFGDIGTVIGSGADPLKIRVDNTGAGHFKLNCPINTLYLTTPAQGIDILTWRPTAGLGRLMLGGSAVTPLMYIETGMLDAGGGVDLGTIHIFGGSHLIRAHGAGTDTPTIYVHGGEVTLQRDFTALYIKGDGKVHLDLHVDGATPDGGTVELDGPSACLRFLSGTVGAGTYYRGELDRSAVKRAIEIGKSAASTFYAGCTEVIGPGENALVTVTGRADKGTGPKKRYV